MNQLVPASYYSVAPETRNRLQDILQGLGDTASTVGSTINDYAYKQPVGSAQRIALGADAATQSGLRRGLGNVASKIPGVTKEAGMRFAMSPAAKGALRIVPGLSFLGAGLGAADVITGDESILNRGMDAAAMGIGGALGMIGGPVGVATGAALGKTLSDGAQFMFGDRKTPEQRKMELALAELRGGVI